MSMKSVRKMRPSGERGWAGTLDTGAGMKRRVSAEGKRKVRDEGTSRQIRSRRRRDPLC